MSFMTGRIGGLLRRSSQQCLNAASLPAAYVMRRGMASSLFIGGLAWGTDDRALQEAFSSFGEIREAKVIMDRETGRSRGFGFVSFFNDNEAEAALKEMDGKSVEGRPIRVSYATTGRGARVDGFPSGGEMGGQDSGFGNEGSAQSW